MVSVREDTGGGGETDGNGTSGVTPYSTKLPHAAFDDAAWESSRSAELLDLCAVRLLNEGDTASLAVVMHITTGKTIAPKDGNSSSKTHYSGFLRHRDVMLCPVAALAQWLAFRWEIAREDVPVSADCSPWYETKLLPGSLKGRRRRSPRSPRPTGSNAPWGTH
jgi:hypothetical protein